jgi:hypothetical protein
MSLAIVETQPSSGHAVVERFRPRPIGDQRRTSFGAHVRLQLGRQ